MYFIGHTRFSLYMPGSNAWNVSGFTEEEYLAHLYSDERMLARMNIFANISVPQLNLMKKNYNYRHIVAYSSNLPEKWKIQLYELATQYPFLCLCEVDTYKGNILNDILKNKTDGSVAYFRLDDDDLLSVNYLECLAKYNKIAYKDMAISFAKGYACAYDNSKFIDFRYCKQHFVSMGQAYIGYLKSGILSLPQMASHHNLDEHLPVIIDAQTPMYIQTYHNQQDTQYRFGNSSASFNSHLLSLLRVDKENEFISHFPQLEKEINLFIEHNKNIHRVFELHNQKINERFNYFTILDKKMSDFFECKYSFSLTEKIVSPKALLIAFSFDREVESTTGLNFTNYNNLGWFKYLNAANGHCSGTLSFTLNIPATLTEIKIVLWDERFKSVIVESIEII